MSAPVARYTIILDRYCTADGDGPGSYHDGTGVDAAKQVAKEIQEAMDEGHIAGHFRVVDRSVYINDAILPGGYAGRDLNQRFEDDPPKPKPPLVACEQCANRDNPEQVEAIAVAPRVVTCPNEDGSTDPWTFTYAPLCGACLNDWWGLNDCDRPDCAPPTLMFPRPRFA